MIGTTDLADRPAPGLEAGIAVPLHRALTEPILLAGLPRSLAITIGTLAASLALGLRLWLPGLVLWVLAHGLCVVLTRRDPQLLAVLARHLHQAPQLRS